MSAIRQVLLVYTDPYYLVKQVYPYGLDLLAARLRQEGIAVTIAYAFLPGADPVVNLSQAVADFTPLTYCARVRAWALLIRMR